MSYAVAPAETRSMVALVAPLSGQLVPIEQVPDPVFAQKMVGDGVSIDPTSQTLLAPCDGEVIQLHPSNHAVTVKTPDGLEVLMHIGLDTVTLRGEGFVPRVQVGDRVRVGDPLINFDADFVATHARSLLTQVVITNSDRVAKFEPRLGTVVGGQDIALDLALGDVSEDGTIIGGVTVASEPIIIPNPTGLHARPSAVLSTLAKKYKSDIRLKYGDKSANARSVIGLMGMSVGNGATVQLEASGPDAEAAIAELSEALRTGLGEEGAKPVAVAASIEQPEISKPAPRPRSEDPNVVLGVAASPGVAVGYLRRVQQQEIAVSEHGGAPNEERRKLEQAIAKASQDVEALRAKVHGQGDPKKSAIFAAHQEILGDPELMDTAASAIDKGKSAAYAWKQTYTSQAEMLSKLDNALLAERANDLRDVGDRVLRILTGVTAEVVTYPEHTILVAEDLTPSDMATLDPTKIAGFCTVAGGATSHVSILARAMDIPSMAGTEPRVLELPEGTPAILDGSKGRLRLNPSTEEMERTQQRIARVKERRQRELATAFEPAITTDGHRIEVVANISNAEEGAKSVKFGGEGVGLLRSELVFMERDSAPDEDEQTVIYSAAARALEGRPLIIRTLDVGGDKPLPYLPIPHEENPFLGERGIRLGFDRPEILRTQFRAILRASEAGKVRIMFPMIARLEEWHMAKQMLEEERQSLGVAPIEAGIMVEVPSTAVMAEQFAREVDFFSVGTNDLTQYTLAMDRGHPKLAPYADALSPGVLGLIGMAARAANKYGKWCGVCGGVAGDPQAVPILIGLGVKELSVSAPTIPSVKAQIRTLSLADCQRLAEQALAADTAEAVRELVPLTED
ncbi:phosphoenolpyruvate--protein phosphotransferase [Thermoleptolyngbya oregonensis NK1-22]|uniref:Phosphocarrier protein HPr n=1 Tax=Thermoleptolyngbya oregonensis NK1-22 TaxID=2547457 RepID=A0AA97BNJ7_9CYAN|nr:phosphoenolpyruvate--protein phosphotransferase [Thermoleptolyngbya oregonensis]WOB41953.1 phosphoenolpyruvate--protein phosphotransferase [Thermoleptolyngbya oregonensis NK1-22]